MALFYYRGLDRNAKKVHGAIESASSQEAKLKLRDQGVMVSQLSTDSKGHAKVRMKGEATLTFTLQLSQLVNAGVPLYQSLTTLEEQYRSTSYHRIFLSLCDQVKGGTALSEAMQQFPETFDRLYTAMIAAGEVSGSLPIILHRLTELLRRQMKLRKEITSSLMYPAILGTFAIIVIALLLGFVIPSIEGIFEGRELNRFTTLVISISHFFRDKWWLYMPVTGGAVGTAIYHFRSKRGKRQLERWLLKIPLVKTLIIQTAVARFSRTMGTLQRGGLTMIEALKMARQVMYNATLEKELVEAEMNIVEGSSLSAELKKSRYIPIIVSRLLAIGEDSGTTAQMLENIATMYEENVEKTLSQIVTLAQPVILIFMGVVIGLVMMAILLPMTEMTTL